MEVIKYLMESNDIYFFKTIPNGFIINDNYTGFIILDDNLNVIKKIQVMEDFIIYTVFIKFENILFHCPDNEALVYYNLKSSRIIIFLLKELSEVIFLAVSFLNDEEILLKTNKNLIFKLNLFSKNIKYINDGFDNNIIFEEISSINNNSVDDEKVFIKEAKDCFHQIEKYEDLTVYISENKTILSNGIEEKIISPDPGYMFLNGQFIKKDNKKMFYLLQKDKSNQYNSKILKFIF